jgi:DivIVA domain-containing protein
MRPESPLDATGIARRQFSIVRKGYDPTEVRAFLNELSELVGRIQRVEAHEHERAERAETRAHLAEQLDEHRLVELLGEETARVLDAARDAAAGIRSKAEESAARMIREAQAEAHAVADQAEREAATRRTEILAEADALRREANDEVERRRVEGQVVAEDLLRAAEAGRDEMLADAARVRAEADAAAEQIRASARDQGRRLVGEAHAVRERILTDLSRRRRVAREQLERLNGARERLLAAYEVVRRTVDEATTELRVSLPQARVASEAAVRRVREEPEESVEVLEAELSVARMSGGVEAGAEVTGDELDAMLRELAEEEAAQATARARAQEAEQEAAAGVGDDPPVPEPGDEGALSDEEPVGSVVDPEPDGGDEPDGAAFGGAAADVEAPPPAASPPAGGQTDAERWGVRLPRSSRRRAADAMSAPRPSVTPTTLTHDEAPAARPEEVPSDASVAAAGPVARDAPPAAGPVAGDAPPAASEDEGETGPYVDELFARIRAERSPGDDAAGEPARPAGTVGVLGDETEVAGEVSDAGDVSDAGNESDAGDASGTGEADDEPLDPRAAALKARDDVLAAVERDTARRLKRVLADEQNQVLDALRRGGTVEFSDVLPAGDEHADRYAIAASAGLDAAAEHGAEAVGGATAASCDELAGALGRTLVDPLRRRVQRSFDDAEGDLEEVTERLRALYREWKGQHIGRAVRHYTAAAYSLGAADVVPKGEVQRWVVDPSCVACPDCDDNALAGEIGRGDSYPTGDTRPPAHQDCRCLVVPVSRLA